MVPGSNADSFHQELPASECSEAMGSFSTFPEPPGPRSHGEKGRFKRLLTVSGIRDNHNTIPVRRGASFLRGFRT